MATRNRNGSGEWEEELGMGTMNGNEEWARNGNRECETGMGKRE